jgi:ABC-type multidrug transport system fused ATPase/permease subunit
MDSDDGATAGSTDDGTTPHGGDREFWLDGFAGLFGFGWLATRLPGDLPPSYLYAVVTVVGSNVLTISYNLANGVPLIYRTNPYFVLQPFVLFAAVYGARTLQAEYDSVLSEMAIKERADDPGSLLDPVPAWLPWVLFGVGAALQLTRAVLDMGGWSVTDMFANFVLFPFVFLPIVVQFFTVYVSIEFLAPWRLSRSTVGIHFLDPQGVGGLRPLGELIKKAYYYVVVGLVGYALITYAPFVDTSWTVSAAAGVLFTTVWVVTVATVAFAVFTLHRFMHREKRAEIQRLESRVRDRIENPWDVQNYEVPEAHREEVEDLRERIQQVSATSEYPATFSIWSQLLLSIAIPKAIQLVLASA